MLVEFGKAGADRQGAPAAGQGAHGARQGADRRSAADARGGAQQARPAPCRWATATSASCIEVGAGVDGFSGRGSRRVQRQVTPRSCACRSISVRRSPTTVDDDAAAFTVLGAIALQGIRLVAADAGREVVVTGLGLIGLLTVQLLRAHGCRVLGIDFDCARSWSWRREFGAEVGGPARRRPIPLRRHTPFRAGGESTRCIITASTSSNEPVHQAARCAASAGASCWSALTGLSSRAPTSTRRN